MKHITDIDSRQVLIEDKGVEILWIEDGYLNDSNGRTRIENTDEADDLIVDWLNAVDRTGDIDPDDIALIHVEYSDGEWKISG